MEATTSSLRLNRYTVPFALPLSRRVRIWTSPRPRHGSGPDGRGGRPGNWRHRHQRPRPTVQHPHRPPRKRPASGAQHQQRQPPIPSGTPPRRPDSPGTWHGWTVMAMNPTGWPDWMHCPGSLNHSIPLPHFQKTFFLEKNIPHTMPIEQGHWDNLPRSLAGNSWNHREKTCKQTQADNLWAQALPKPIFQPAAFPVERQEMTSKSASESL